MDNQVIEAKALINDGGRILIPVNIRRALGLDIGDEVLLRMQAQEVHVIPLYKAVQEAQEMIRRYNRDKLRLTDVLSDLRKEDFNNE